MSKTCAYQFKHVKEHNKPITDNKTRNLKFLSVLKPPLTSQNVTCNPSQKLSSISTTPHYTYKISTPPHVIKDKTIPGSKHSTTLYLNFYSLVIKVQRDSRLKILSFPCDFFLQKFKRKYHRLLNTHITT